jgi:hypothetical protein
MGKKSRSGSGMNIPEHISESLEAIFELKILKFFDADADSGYGYIFVMYSQWGRFFSLSKATNFFWFIWPKSFFWSRRHCDSALGSFY